MDSYTTTTLMAPEQTERRTSAVRSSVRVVSMLPERRPPWKEFSLSIVCQSGVVALFLWIGILHPNIITAPLRDYHAVRLVNTPHPVDHEPAPPRPMRVAPVAELKDSVEVRLPSITPKVPHPDLPQPPAVQSQTKIPVQPAAVVIPKEAVKTNVFSTGSSQAPTIERSPQQVQTGGFGDPHGVASQNNVNQPVTIARQGGFDLPSGEGYGNGTGGAHGKSGVVASGGFGDGVAIAKAGSPNLAVHSGMFGDAQTENPTRAAAKHDDAAGRIKPAEILSKPVPAYTDEARKLHIEGEVLLEVVFESSGSIHVIRVVHGLGHGLDEAAIKAAQQIRFNPAQKDGQPVDFTGMLHIVFQLA